jgi:hypothetical protein
MNKITHITYIKKMDSIEYLEDGLVSSLLINKSLYQNEMIEEKISHFIKDKEEIQTLLRKHPEKKEKYYGFLVYAFIDVKIQQMANSFKRDSEEGIILCLQKKYEGMTPKQIADYKEKIDNFFQNVYGDSIDFVHKILSEGKIEEMLGFVFSSEKHYHNMIIFLSGKKEKYIMN